MLWYYSKALNVCSFQCFLCDCMWQLSFNYRGHFSVGDKKWPVMTSRHYSAVGWRSPISKGQNVVSFLRNNVDTPTQHTTYQTHYEVLHCIDGVKCPLCYNIQTFMLHGEWRNTGSPLARYSQRFKRWQRCVMTRIKPHRQCQQSHAIHPTSLNCHLILLGAKM